RPSSAIDTARLTDVDVLPTPPLPLVTAMTCTGRVERSVRRPAAWCPLRPAGGRLIALSGAGMDGSELKGQRAVIDLRRVLARELHRPQHQLVGTRRVNVLGYPLSVAQVVDRQRVPDHRRQRRADARGLVELAEHAGFRLRGTE